MSYISEKIAFLDGLAEGQEIGGEKYGKLIRGIIDALGAIAEELEQQNESIDDLSDALEEIREELDDLEDGFYDDMDEDDEGGVMLGKCPNCGEEVYISMDMLDEEGGLICPNCNAEIELDSEDDEDDEGDD